MNAAKPTILVVDSSPKQIEQLSISLIDHHEVIVATNGPEALEIAEKGAPDMIFLDVTTPGMDILEICSRLKSNQVQKNTPLVLLVSNKQANDDDFYRQVGGLDCVDRSIRPAMVRACVRMHLAYKRKLEKLRRMVVTDGLTELSNRRHFEEILDREWRRTMREKTGLSVILSDIDHFKQFNDHYGHISGDRCLKIVAQAMKNSLRRPTDFLARIGGEEFATVLYHMDWKGTEARAQEMCRQVESLRTPHAKSTCADVVTISIGYATMTPTRGSTPQPLMEAADQMLYKSKLSGKNQVQGVLL